MTLEELRADWEKEAKIDKNDLTEETIKTSSLHPKYVAELSKARLQVKAYEMQYDELYKTKWLYYTGKLSEKEINKRGWDPDPLDGLKVMKGDLEMWYKTDKDLVALKKKREVCKEKILFLEEVINTLRWRHSAIKNIIEWTKFTSGY